MGAESPHSHGSGHRCCGEGSWQPGLGRGKGSWVRREDKEDTRCYRAPGEPKLAPLLPLARFPSESSHLAQPSACTHTHACTHNHMRASQCLAPYGEVRRVFKRDQLSMYIIYIFLKKKTSLVLWWRRWGSWRHPEGRHARHPHAHHGDKVRRVHGRRRRRGWGIHHAGGTRWRRRRRGRGPGRQRRLDPGGQGHHSGVALHLRGSWRSCGSRLLLLPWRDGPCASARGGSRRILLPWQGGAGSHTAAGRRGWWRLLLLLLPWRKRTRGRRRGLPTGRWRRGRHHAHRRRRHHTFSLMQAIDPRAHRRTSQVLIHWRRAMVPRWVGALVHRWWWWLHPRWWWSIWVVLHGMSTMPTCQAG